MKRYLKPLALLLTIVGVINCLTFAVFDLNLVNYICGGYYPAIEKAVYIVVGLLGIYSISLFQEVCGMCSNDSNN